MKPKFAGIEGIYILAISTPSSGSHLFVHSCRGQFSEYTTLEVVLQTRARSHGIVFVGQLLAFVFVLLYVYSQKLQDVCKSCPRHHGSEAGYAFLFRPDCCNWLVLVGSVLSLVFLDLLLEGFYLSYGCTH